MCRAQEEVEVQKEGTSSTSARVKKSFALLGRTSSYRLRRWTADRRRNRVEIGPTYFALLEFA